ncbi:MAG: flagellar motor switch protein FliN [Deltaproteobacteria bacterium]|nr:MAG: flagellar motor switch protein FliN [Deltaproteobacteria bacterium]
MTQDHPNEGVEKETREAEERGANPNEFVSLNAKGISNLDFILDIPLEVSVELGRTKMNISDLLQLGQGSVIELTKLAGEPLEILVNQRLVARGEVVVVNEKFGVRLTDIISPADRVKQLGS